MIKSKHPFNIQNDIKPNITDRVVYDPINEIEVSDPYYDILKDVYEQDKKPASTYSYPTFYDQYDPRFEPMHENDWYGFLENSSLLDISLCADYLSKRDNIPTTITGVFGGEPVHFIYSLVRRCPSIFHEYTLTHYSAIYRTNNFRVIKNDNGVSFIDPNILIKPSVDMEGFFYYNLPVSGFGIVTIKVHELVGMTFLPPIFNNRELFEFYHLDGDLTHNHFQNIGILRI